MLIVLAIIGVAAGAVALGIGAATRAPNVEAEARRFANRLQAEFEPLIGCFLNTLVIRVDVADGISFAALLDQVRRTTLEAYRYREAPFERLVELLAPGRIDEGASGA